jgi:hypothetical protein
VTCTQTGNTVVIVNDGKQTQKLNIPVKRIPDPIAIVGGSAGSNEMTANTFRVQGGVIAELRDFVFEGINFKVVSFVVIASGKGFDEPEVAKVNGAAFANGAKDLVRRCQPGTTVTIADIKLSEPGGGSRKLDQTITFILQ